MGFEADVVQRALLQAGGNEERAVNLIISDRWSCHVFGAMRWLLSFFNPAMQRPDRGGVALASCSCAPRPSRDAQRCATSRRPRVGFSKYSPHSLCPKTKPETSSNHHRQQLLYINPPTLCHVQPYLLSSLRTLALQPGCWEGGPRATTALFFQWDFLKYAVCSVFGCGPCFNLCCAASAALFLFVRVTLNLRRNRSCGP